MNENVTLMTVLEELKDFRAENNKRWEENDKKWEANDKKIDALDARVSKLEERRKSDKREIVEVLDTMQKSIDKQFAEMKEYMTVQIDKINAALIANEVEHKKYREDIKNLNKRYSFQNYRITSLEKWKDNFEDGIIGVC